MSNYLDPGLLGLAFDLYQRYRLVAEALDRLRVPGQNFNILEVGGHPGFSRKFLEGDQVIVADLINSGNELDLMASCQGLPYPDRAFPVVIAVDVLEHLSPEHRKASIEEIARVSSDLVMVAAPFEYALARSAEKLIFDFIKEWLGYEHNYLKEHLENPAPNLVETESELVRLGFDTVVLPNGLLERWLLMMFAYYYYDGFPSAMELRREITEFYNRNYFWQDLAEPAYRHLIVASRNSLRQRPGALDDLVAKKQQLPEPDYKRFQLWLELFRLGQNKRMILKLAELENQLKEKDDAIAHQQAYIAQLEDFHKKVKGTLVYKIYETLFKRN